MQIKEFLKQFKLKNFLMLTIAGVVNAFGITIFLAPVKLFDTGISGTSMLLASVTPERWSLSIFLLILNIPMFLYGLKRQGAVFTVYAIYAVSIYSLGSWLITDVLPIDVSMASPLAGRDLLLCAAFGGLISGVGSGLAIRHGGALDGIEVMSIIFSKKLGVTVGTFVMVYNVILYICCGFVLKSWILPLYSMVSYFAALKTIDYIVEGFDRSKGAIIITGKPEKVCKALSDAFSHGMTTLNAKGYYSGKDKTMIYFVVNRFQVSRMKDIVREIDRNAYISITEIADIFTSESED